MIAPSLQEFYSKCQKGKPILAVDYGVKKVGIAISDPMHIMALPYTILRDVKSEAQKIEKIASLCCAENISGVVVGLPVNMDGTDSSQTKLVNIFAAKLSQKIDLPIYLQDERLTSRFADNFLKGFGLNRKQRNERDDLAAASMILETALERKSRQNLSFLN